MACFPLRRFASLAFAASLTMLPVSPALGGVGDLLVAPTRVVLNGSRGTEVILNNIGDDVATYRVSAELRRMTPEGKLEDVAAPNERETAARDMILFAPRKVTLPPNQPQAIRLSARAPEGLPDGEYRIHLLFRAIPAPQPATAAEPKIDGVAFQLRPIYGVTIPVIVRLGNLEAKAALSNVQKISDGGKPAISLDISRSGDRSTFGEIKVFKAGVSEPIAQAAGIAVYTEVSQRSVVIPIDPAKASSATGAVRIEYVEPTDTGPVTIAETSAVLR